MNKYTKIEWWNACDLDQTLYQEGFKNWLYLDCDPTLPTFDIEADSYDDGLGATVNRFRRLRALRELQFIAPEFLLDALTLLPLCSDVYIYTRDGQSFRMSDITFTTEWIEGDCLALVTMQFLADQQDRAECCGDLRRCFDVTLEPVIDVLEVTDPVFTDPADEGINEGSRYFFWSVSANDGYTLTGDIYTLVGGVWQAFTASTDDVFVNSADGQQWYFDGAIWQAFPVIYEIDQSEYPDYTIFAYIPYNAWGDLYENYNGGGWSLYGRYTSQQLAAGIPYSLAEIADVQFKIEVQNHSCYYGFTNTEAIELPCDYEFLLNHEFDSGPLLVNGNVQNWTTNFGRIVQSGVAPIIRVADPRLANGYISQTVELVAGYTYKLRFRLFGNTGAVGRFYKIDDGVNYLLAPNTWTYNGVGTQNYNDTATWTVADTQNIIPNLLGFEPPYGATALAVVRFTVMVSGTYTVLFQQNNISTLIDYISIERDCD